MITGEIAMKPELLPTTPEPIAEETWLVPTLAADPSGGFLGAHSAVIRGAEPMIVDTSVLFGRDQWMQNVFSLVEPEDVRWIFLSHDDHDHLGNLEVLLEQCPQATLLTDYAMVARLFGDIELPLDRLRWVNVGETVDLGDRELAIVRPPMFDSPASRGLFDTSTGVLWAADSFGASFPGAVYDANDIPDEVYDPSFELLNLLNTPWLEWVDQTRFDAHVRTTESLPTTVVASAHGPLHRGPRIADAFRRTRALAGNAPAEQPGQDVLELLRAMLATTTV
jgi:flavorubredoxin